MDVFGILKCTNYGVEEEHHLKTLKMGTYLIVQELKSDSWVMFVK